MNSPRVLALVTGHPTPADLTEWLRVVAAFVAIGSEVRLVEIRCGRGVLSAEGLTSEAERYLEGLEALDVRLESLEGASLRDAVLGANTILRIGDPARSGTPQVLEASRAWLTGTPAADLPAALASAGQVVGAGSAELPARLWSMGAREARPHGNESGPGRFPCRGRVQAEGTCEIRDVVEGYLAGQTPA